MLGFSRCLCADLELVLRMSFRASRRVDLILLVVDFLATMWICLVGLFVRSDVLRYGMCLVRIELRR